MSVKLLNYTVFIQVDLVVHLKPVVDYLVAQVQVVRVYLVEDPQLVIQVLDCSEELLVSCLCAALHNQINATKRLHKPFAIQLVCPAEKSRKMRLLDNKL